MIDILGSKMNTYEGHKKFSSLEISAIGAEIDYDKVCGYLNTKLLSKS